MRFSILILAVAVLGLASCQVPEPTTASAPVQVAAPEAPPPATPAPIQAPAPPTAAPVAEAEVEAEVDTAPVEEAETEEPVPTGVQANASTEQAETAAPEQADELAPEDAPADSQMADTTVESSEKAAMSPPQEASEVQEVEDAAVIEVAAASSAPKTEDTTEPEVPLNEDNDGAVEIALAPPPPPPELNPETLVGLDEAGLRQRLGEADFRRREGGMETRQYRLADCVVDYFLFPADNGPQIVAWSWRAPVIGGTVDAVACRRALAERDFAG